MKEERRVLTQTVRLLTTTVLLLSVVVAVAEAKGDGGYKIWPMPESVSSGHTKLYLPALEDFQILLSVLDDANVIIIDGFHRMLDALSMAHSVSSSPNSSASPVLKGIRVLPSNLEQQLQFGVDESYKLLVPSPHEPDYALLQTQTVYGALRGFQTFSQLCYFNVITRLIEVRTAPWTIVDRPRFPYRGLLIDTARHYQPLSSIKKVIDSMEYAKLNVLHWHIVDTESFPLEVPSYPKLSDGAFSIVERYTFADAAEIVSYAERRGINVLAEIDVPGHAGSWGTGYPALWPSKDCRQPLDVSNEFTFKVIDGILSDFSKIFKFKFVHLGGDEVNTSCWKSTPHINKWLRMHRMDESQAYQYFVLRAQKIALSHGYDIINWEETFNAFGSKLSRRTVVHNWLGGGVAERAVSSGLRCIVSNQDKWYLDHLDTTWQEFYINEPLTNITKPEQQKLVIGGEVCVWGERVDASNIEQTIWPRAAAAAERLWTPYDKIAKDPEQVAGRLAHFRCLLNQRGVAAAPVTVPGREAPLGPGSCHLQ